MQTEAKLLKILIVEDDEDDFYLVSHHFKKIESWQFELSWQPDYKAAVKQLITNEYSICFTDYRLGAQNGIELIIESIAKGTTTPMILLTGKGSTVIDREATKAGAFDFLIKDELDSDKLERTIRYTLERAATLEKLVASEKRYRSFFERSKDIVFMATTDGSFITINQSVEEMLAYTPEQLKGKQVYDLFKEENQRQFFIRSLQQEGEIDNYEAMLVDANGGTVSCLISASKETEGDNEYYLQGIIHDISGLKNAERMTVRNEKMAATGRFIQTLAHEVRNPLKNIKMAVQQLLKPNNQVDDKILLEIVERSEVKIDDLITELLQSSNPPAMNWQVIEVNKVVADLIAAVADKATLRHITITSHGGPDCRINADAAKLQMALLNIIVNAIEAVKEGTGLIEISWYCYHGIVDLQIKDNGPGIKPEDKVRLFEPYFTSKKNGVGLGLASTLNILQSHQARIEVESEIDKGTLFKIIFLVKE